MKKLLAVFIILLLLGGVFGFAPMAYADGVGSGAGSNVIPPRPPGGSRSDGGSGGIIIPPRPPSGS